MPNLDFAEDLFSLYPEKSCFSNVSFGWDFYSYFRRKARKYFAYKEVVPARPPPNKPSTSSGQGLRVPPCISLITQSSIR